MVVSLENVLKMPNDGTETYLEYSYTIKPVNDNITYTEWYNNTLSVIGFEVELRRYYTSAMINFYFPSLIFVLVSWISSLP